jgi:hypothetical protein
MVYQCHRCFYVSKNRKDMKKHLNRKNKCLRTIDSYNFDEDLLDEYSLKKINEDQVITKKNSYSNIKTYFGDQKEENNVVVKNDISLDKIDDPFLDNQDLFLFDNNHSNDNHIKEQNEIQNTVQNTAQNEIQNEHLDKFQAHNSILKQKKLDVDSIKNETFHRSQLEKIKGLNNDSFPKNKVLNFDQVHNKLQNKLEQMNQQNQLLKQKNTVFESENNNEQALTLVASLFLQNDIQNIHEINELEEEKNDKKVKLIFENDQDYIGFIKKNNIVDCLYCKRTFYRKYELIRHIQNKCNKKKQYIDDFKEQQLQLSKKKDASKNLNNDSGVGASSFNEYLNSKEFPSSKDSSHFKKNQEFSEYSSDSQEDNHHTTVNNTMNQMFNNQQINNISINVYNNEENKQKFYMIPFDQEWDLSNIDHQKKLLLFLSDNKYSNTMEEILKNDKNKNVLFDDDNDSGLVFQNDKFINMASDEIIIKMIYKLYNHLNTFYNEIKNNDYINCDLDKHKDTLEEKYNDFNENKHHITKEVVKNILVDIFHNNKENIIKQFVEFNKFLSEEEKQKIGY